MSPVPGGLIGLLAALRYFKWTTSPINSGDTTRLNQSSCGTCVEKSRALWVKPCKTAAVNSSPGLPSSPSLHLVPIHFLKLKPLVPSGGHIHIAQQVATLHQLAGLSVAGWVGSASLKTKRKYSHLFYSADSHGMDLQSPDPSFSQHASQGGSSLPPARFIWKDAVAQRLYSADARSKWSRSWVLFSLLFTDRDATAC